MSHRALGACAGVLAVAGIWTLPFHNGRGPGETRVSSPPPDVRAQLRDEALGHARTRLGAPDAGVLTAVPPDPSGTLSGQTVDCQFVPTTPPL